MCPSLLIVCLSVLLCSIVDIVSRFTMFSAYRHVFVCKWNNLLCVCCCSLSCILKLFQCRLSTVNIVLYRPRYITCLSCTHSLILYSCREQCLIPVSFCSDCLLLLLVLMFPFIVQQFYFSNFGRTIILQRKMVCFYCQLNLNNKSDINIVGYFASVMTINDYHLSSLSLKLFPIIVRLFLL